jgi:hypothetical protein
VLRCRRRPSRIEASAAVSAAAEPEMLAMMTAATMATMPRPPRMWPTQAMANSTMRRDRPPAFMISPASRKKGMAKSVKVSAPVIMRCETICVSKMPP